jgi:hypothetical protein
MKDSKSKKYHISLHKFSAGKQNFNLSREKKKSAAHLKAAALRKYAKLAKKEGIVSDRVRIGGEKSAPVGDVMPHKVREKKSFPFSKELILSSKREEDFKEQAEGKERKQAVHAKKQEERDKRRKILLKRFQAKKLNIGGQASILLEKIMKSTKPV